jgi:hypothetical protein
MSGGILAMSYSYQFQFNIVRQLGVRVMAYGLKQYDHIVAC